MRRGEGREKREERREKREREREIERGEGKSTASHRYIIGCCAKLMQMHCWN